MYKILKLNCPGKIFFGPVPFKDDMYRLKKNGVDAVWNLLAEFPDVETEQEIFCTVYHSPIEDYSVPDQNSNFLENLEQVCNMLKSDKNILVHCFGGKGRTGMALAVILMKLNNISAEEALELTYRCCRGPETEEQKEYVRALEPLCRKPLKSES